MLRPGLVSVTFRKLTPRQIIDLCVDAGLEGIEWGGDVHVPPGDLENAAAVREAMEAAGLEVVCYGSYYRCDGGKQVAFESVLETALALGAPVIRVWAGQKGSDAASEEDWAAVVADLKRISKLAATKGVKVASEYHGQTLTDTRAAARRLLNEVAHSNYLSLWQPLRRTVGDAQVAENLADLEDVLPQLAHVHVYEWIAKADGGREALPLKADGQWVTYLERLRQLDGDRWLLLEFVPGDQPTVLNSEAATLHVLTA